VLVPLLTTADYATADYVTAAAAVAAAAAAAANCYVYCKCRCGTGLSMFMIQSTWPQAQLLGVDLSTYKLAIASAKLSTKPAAVAERVKLVHKPAEATGEADGSYDLATVCLVSFP
jgi:trans-aconitate methyltransferase